MIQIENPIGGIGKGGLLTYAIRRNPAADDLAFLPEYSLDLRIWHPIEEGFEHMGGVLGEAGAIEENWRSHVPVASTRKLFIRLRLKMR